MSDCELLFTCPFFHDQMQTRPAAAEMYKKSYCKGDSANCARFIVFKALGRTKVPPDLFPNQLERAEKLLGLE